MPKEKYVSSQPKPKPNPIPNLNANPTYNPNHNPNSAAVSSFLAPPSLALQVWSGQQGFDMAEGCTSLIVGREATTNGATVTSHTNDCLNCDFRLAKIPAADHGPDDVVPVFTIRAEYPRFLGEGRGPNYLPENTDTSFHPEWVGSPLFDPMGSIPQVEHTYAYLDGGYGIMNEHQVAMGESTCGGRLTALPVSKGGKALVDVSFLNRVALERCTTALCAVEMMVGLSSLTCLALCLHLSCPLSSLVLPFVLLVLPFSSLALPFIFDCLSCPLS